MKIAFLDPLTWDFKVESVYQKPLGGSESALCYLAEILAKQGHEVFLISNTSEPGLSCGVLCLPFMEFPNRLSEQLDILIVAHWAECATKIKPTLPEKTCLVLWTQQADDQDVVQDLLNPTARDVYDGVVLVSDWQRDRFYEKFNINLDRTKIFRNAIAPVFCNMFSDETSILAQKSHPPVLAYTSTPYRGLDILLEVFPRIRQIVPGTTLKVFSSMKVYQVSEEQDSFSGLYQKCQTTEGVEYIGSLPQPELARELRSAMVLAYPNTFAETSCIAVMEAMASGCWIVTSNLGALPETSAGFARLIPITDDIEAYKDRFVEETIQVLKACTATDNTQAETHLKEQVNYVNNEYIWSVRAQEWRQWLSSITGYKCLIHGDYDQAATIYEQEIAACPTEMSNYWYLGLSLLLQGQEVEAVSTWMLPILNSSEQEVDILTAELSRVLKAEVERLEATQDQENALIIKQQLEELSFYLV